MREWLQPAILTSGLNTLLLAGIFLYLFWRKKDRGLGIWTAAWFFYSLRFVFEWMRVPHPGSAGLMLAFQSCTLLNGVFLLWGMQVCVHRRLHWAWVTAAAGCGAWMITSVWSGLSFYYLTLPLFFFLGAVFITMGVSLIRNEAYAGFGKQLAGWALVIWGVHKLNYPFMRSLEWFAPWGYILASGLTLATAIGFILIFFEQSSLELTQSRAALQSIFRAAPVGIGVVCNRVFNKVNLRLCEMTGYGEQELLGQSSRMLYPTDDDYEFVGREKYKQIMAQGTGTVETRWRCKDGRVLDVLLSSTPINPSDLSAGVTFTALDITARKQAERRLRSSEESLRTLIEASKDAIVSIDPHGQITLFSQAAEELFGWEADQMLGSPFTRLLAPQGGEVQASLPDFSCSAGVCLAHATPIVELGMQHKDGHHFSAELSFSQGKHEGRPFTLAIIRDISQRKRAEQEKAKLESQLTQAQKLEAIGRLASGVAHDFNNLLQGIQGYTHLAREDLDEGHPSQEHLTEVLSAIDRCIALIRQLMTFSRQEPFQPADVDLNSLVASSLRMIKRIIGEHIDLKFIPTTPLASVLADPVRVEQILMNLCVNARDAMPQGGTITVESAPACYDEEDCLFHPWARPGQYVMLAVSDTGHGMPASVREHIFEPFFTTKKGGEGTGLGLATVYGLVQQHGGLIHVYSEPGQGSVFRVYLPAAQSAQAEVPEQDTTIQSTQGGHNEMILLAEDDDLVRDLAVRILTKAGYRLVVARDGEEAIGQFDQNKEQIDMAILDVVMPKANGKTVAAHIRRASPFLPILYSSGYSNNQLGSDFKADPTTKLMAKPYSPRQLLREVGQFLDEHATQQH